MNHVDSSISQHAMLRGGDFLYASPAAPAYGINVTVDLS
jgi:uncharacterized RmlC-like cupin family protein